MKKNLIKAICTAAWRIGVQYCTSMKRYANHPDKYPMNLKYRKLRKLVNHIANGFDMDIVVSGLENMPKEICALYSNHLAAFDPVPIIKTLDAPMTFLAKSELEKVPFVYTAIKSIEGEFIHRDNLKQSFKIMMKIEEDLKERRKNWLIFPEGTRNKDDKAVLLEFHHGTFRPAMKAEVPLVPVAIFGTQRVMDKTKRLKKYPVHLIIGKPIYPEEYKEISTTDIAKIMQSKIQYMLTYQSRKLDRAYLKNSLGDKFKENI